MTELEKIIRHDTLTTLRELMGGCFGSSDGKFALHPNEENRAKELLKLAEKSKITLIEVKEISLAYLYNKGFYDVHIKSEMKEITKFFSKKLH